MVKKRIYIAGPMRGYRFFNFPAFDAARDQLESEGWTVVSPADLDREVGFDPTSIPEPDGYDWQDLNALSFSLREAVKRDTEAIMSVDAIYLLEGWGKSRGVRAELALAEWLGLEVIHEKDEDVLEEALRITRGDRQASYGPPDQDFQRTAAMWSALKGVDFTAKEVASFMVALKLSRQTHQDKRDNWVDIAGYARCGSLCRS